MPRKRRQKTQDTILAAYDRDASVYGAFAHSLRGLVANILEADSIAVHSVTCRLKHRASLADKLTRSGAKYERLTDITDICGVRIITYFEDSVDRIAELIEREFAVDRANSIDKGATLDPDQFGYLSLHHVVSLRPERGALAEYRRFSGLKAEVQTRSILQHAWAEIEHDLGYKASLDVPRELRRRFARLAGLLEIADEEFTSIRDALREYERAVPGRIVASPRLVGLDKASLTAFVEGSELVQRLDQGIASATGAQLVQDDPDFLEGDATLFAAVGIRTIAELDAAVRRDAPLVAEFSRVWLEGDDHTQFHVGISLFYLWYVLVARTLSPGHLRETLLELNIGLSDEVDEAVRHIRETYQIACARAGLDMPVLPEDPVDSRQ